MIHVKRIYDKPEKTDGYRVLVDKLWPRGVSRAMAKLDDTFGTIAPGDALRKWFDHDPEKWKEFCKRYRQELKNNHEEVMRCFGRIGDKKTITFLYGAKNSKHTHALVLQEHFNALFRDHPAS